MGILDKIRRDKQGGQEDTELAGVANTAVATLPQRRAIDEQNRSEKGIDIDMIDPDEVVAMFTSIAEYTIPQYKLMGEPPNVQVVQLPPIVKDRPWAKSILIYLNKVWPTIIMEPYYADTMRLRIQTAFSDIRKSMGNEDLKRYKSMVKAAENLCLARCEDMKGGNKATLMKVQSSSLTVKMRREQQEKVKA